MFRAILFLLGLAASLASAAADRLVAIETRPGVRVSYWLMERPGASATVMLLPGGEGGIGMKDGVPTSQNFLVRSRDFFAAAGYNVAIVGKPSDRADLDPGFRVTDAHVTDLRRIAGKLREDFGKPVWLVGTSLGTLSAAATAIAAEPGEIAGIVLSSSRTGGNYPTVPGLALSKIRVPVLVMHHRDDACPSCNPREAARITSALTSAPVKRFILVEGGGGAQGPPCEALHYHGYIGMEKEAVDTIGAWIRAPSGGS